MGKRVYNENNMPQIENEQLKKAFKESIASGIKAFAKENGMSIEEATQVFENKIKNIPIKMFNYLTLDKEHPEQQDRFAFKLGLTDIIIDPEEPQKPAKKTIYINEALLEDKNELKSTLMHEIFHLVLSDDKMKFNNGKYMYNMGCHETQFQNGKTISSKGLMMHEALVARMQKKFCQKEGIKFEEKGLFSSGYVNEMKIIEQVEKEIGKKIEPKKNLSDFNSHDKDKLEKIAGLLDAKEYSKCEEMILKIKDEKIHQKYGDNVLNFVKSVRKIRDNIKNAILRKNEPKLLNETNNLDESLIQKLEPRKFAERAIPSEKNAAEKFADEISMNGELRKIKPITPKDLQNKDNNQNKVIKKDEGEIEF